MDGSSGPSDRLVGETPRGVLPMIKYQIRPRGATVRWSPANRFRRCECRHTYAYPNTIVLVVIEEREALAKDNARLEIEVNQLKETNKMQVEWIKELEYDVVKGQERIDDLGAQLGKAQERMVTRTMKVRTRAESILNVCDDLLGEASDGTSHIGDSTGAEPAEVGGSASPAADLGLHH